MRAEVAADAGQNRHLEAESPLHPVRQNEGHRGNADGDDRGDDLQGIHLVNVVDAADAEESHDEKAAACAEVADVDADDDHADQEPCVVALVRQKATAASCQEES